VNNYLQPVSKNPVDCPPIATTTLQDAPRRPQKSEIWRVKLE